MRGRDPKRFDCALWTFPGASAEGSPVFQPRSAPASVYRSMPREGQLEEKIQGLKARQAELDGEAKSAQRVSEFLSRLGVPGEKPAPIPDARSLGSIVDLIRKGSGESLARVQRVQVQKREIGRR